MIDTNNMDDLRWIICAAIRILSSRAMVLNRSSVPQSCSSEKIRSDSSLVQEYASSAMMAQKQKLALK